MSGARKLALSWLALVALVALMAPYLPLPFAPAIPDLAYISVSPGEGAAVGHWLGTDPLGRDVLANLLFGARTVLMLTVPAAGLAALLGGLLGSAAGYWRQLRLPGPAALLGVGLGWWALALPLPEAALAGCAVAAIWALVLRVYRRRPPCLPIPLDALVLGAGAALKTVPRLLLVTVLAAAQGAGSLAGLLGLLVLTSWPGPARLVRAETLRLRHLPFVEAARALGLPTGRIWWHHVLPQALRPLRTELPLSLATLLGLESTLSFLGIGLSPDVASWGRLLSAARLDPSAWWTTAPPALALLLTIAAARTLASK